MGTIPQINTRIYANIVKPGMIVEIDGQRITVAASTENYSTITLTDLLGHATTVDYAATVKLVGYFNP